VILDGLSRSPLAPFPQSHLARLYRARRFGGSWLGVGVGPPTWWGSGVQNRTSRSARIGLRRSGAPAARFRRALGDSSNQAHVSQGGTLKVRAKAILQRRRSASRARCSGARVRYAGRSTRPRLCNRVRSEIERRHPRLLSHGDDDLASSMTLFDVPDGRWGLAKRCREYCSATSPRWAERTTRIEGVAGGFLQTTAVWVAVDVETGRPVRLDHSFTRIYGPSAEGLNRPGNLGGSFP